MKRDLVLFIEDIMEKILLIEKSTKGISKSDFSSDELLVDATMRRLEIIGEAAKNISESFRKKYPEVEWRKISGFRDILVHAYFRIDIDVMWDIIKKDVPILKKQIKEILEKDK